MSVLPNLMIVLDKTKIPFKNILHKSIKNIRNFYLTIIVKQLLNKSEEWFRIMMKFIFG